MFSCFLLANKNFAIVWCCVYRSSQIYTDRIRDFFETPWIYLIYASCQLIAYLLIISAFSSANTDNDARPQFVAENPDLAYLNETIICLPNRGQTVLASLSMFVYFVATFVFATAILITLFFRIKSSKNTSHKNTYNLQVMLFKALVAQATIGCLFLLFPGEFK
jgi:uncharacterized membrane protein